MTGLLNEGFELPTVLDAYNIEAITGGVSRSTTVKKDGTASCKFYINEADTGYGGGSSPHRAEIHSNVEEFAFNQDYWLGMNVYLENWTSDPEPEQIIQFHNVPNFGAGETWGTLKLMTPFGIQIKNNIYEVVHGFVQDSDAANPNGTVVNNRVAAGAITNNGWTKWVIHCRWHYSTGILQVWKDDVLVYSKTGNTYYNDETGPYHKVGIYKWPWVYVGNISTTTERTMYLDNWKIVQGADAGYNDANPTTTMATSTLANIKVIATEPGNYQAIHRVSSGLLKTEKVTDFVVKPGPTGIVTPNEPFGYAEANGTAVVGGGAGSTMSVTNQHDLVSRAKIPNTVTYVAADITNTNTNLATTTKNGAFFQSDKSNISIIGLPGVTLRGFGWGWISPSEIGSNIILRNLKFRDMANIPGGRDYLSFRGHATIPFQAPLNIWMDHIDFGGGQTGLDACIDATGDVRYYTISNSILADESVACMLGGLGTFAYNWLRDNLDRQPKCVHKFLDGSQSHIHIYNNLFERTPAGNTRWAGNLPYKGYAIGYGGGIHVLNENNIYLNYPGWRANNMSDPAAGDGYGHILTRGNKYINSPNTTDRNFGAAASTIEVPYDTEELVYPVTTDADATAMIDYIKKHAGATLTTGDLGL